MTMRRRCQKGSILVVVIVLVVTLAIVGLGVMTVSFGVRHRAVVVKNEATAMLAAEAGYEQAVYVMSQQPDMLTALNDSNFEDTGTLTFENSECSYEISFYQFLGARPVYRILSQGQCGTFSRAVDVYVVQAVSGWDMGQCRVPSSRFGTYPVSFADNEVIDLQIHINNRHDDPDERDIYVNGNPEFRDTVEMGEARETSGGTDKYASLIDVFDNGIFFDQPDSRIADSDEVADKVSRFEDSTDNTFRFDPDGEASLTNAQSAVQLEFFVESGVGKIRITNDCTVRGFRQSSDSRTWDYRVKPDCGGSEYERYHIYSYHVIPDDAEATGLRRTVDVEDTYVQQEFGGVHAAPGGQIFVDGNVIIGGDSSLHNGDQLVNGKITIVATGNIWIADSLKVDGSRDSEGMPVNDNPNIIGLIAQGVIRVVDPGMSDYSYVDDSPTEPAGYDYVPVGIVDSGQPLGSHKRHLSAMTTVEAALTIGGGGFGAENVRRSSYGGRKEFGGAGQDRLVLHGTISEVLRGVVGLIGYDGYLKWYFMDSRLLQGILPSDFWLKGKYIPAPAGWHDYRI